MREGSGYVAGALQPLSIAQHPSRLKLGLSAPAQTRTLAESPGPGACRTGRSLSPRTRHHFLHQVQNLTKRFNGAIDLTAKWLSADQGTARQDSGESVASAREPALGFGERGPTYSANTRMATPQRVVTPSLRYRRSRCVWTV